MACPRLSTPAGLFTIGIHHALQAAKLSSFLSLWCCIHSVDRIQLYPLLEQSEKELPQAWKFDYQLESNSSLGTLRRCPASNVKAAASAYAALLIRSGNSSNKVDAQKLMIPIPTVVLFFDPAFQQVLAQLRLPHSSRSFCPRRLQRPCLGNLAPSLARPFSSLRLRLMCLLP
ncbi:hypothetical protein IE53DRAFT_172113 [Violaceomyces palustris]|uniref:Uncharacterized protein n=1 Tax=Violaceomyces palustris TaxID=1673888 RepID=A0ACD0NSX7_9BASI|nr:hypothetical protein IE53DRAFT_172113 [Violaceomyces palustris]